MDENSILTSGKYKGYRLGDVPESFLRFLYDHRRYKLKGGLREYVERKFYNSIS